ncbi:hypothetical protein [Methylobacterium sp. CM6257]
MPAMAPPSYSANGLSTGYPGVIFTRPSGLKGSAQLPPNAIYSAMVVGSVSAASSINDRLASLAVPGQPDYGPNALVQIFRNGLNSIAHFDNGASATVAVTTGVPAIFAQIAQTPTTTAMYFNDTAGATAAISPKSPTLMGIGCHADDGSEQLLGVIAEQIIWTGIISPTDLAKMQGYAAWNNGTQGSLSANHPYKSAAPTVTPLPAGTRLWSRATNLGAKLLAGYRADDPNMVLQQTNVATLPDYGPAGVTMSQSIVGKQPPVIEYGLNGRRYLKPNNGAPHGLEGSKSLKLMNKRPGYTVIGLFRRLDGGLYGESDANGASYSGVRYYNPNVNVYLRGDNYGASNGYSFNGGDWTNWHIIAFRDTVTHAEVSVDGGPWQGGDYTRPDTTFDLQTDFRLFSIWQYDYGGMDWAEMLFLDSIAADDIDRTVGALAWDWGPPDAPVNLVGQLPAGHPYKAAAPTVSTASSKKRRRPLALIAS